jgi:mannose-1-phosphate guanylyltransferase/mannose-1-phosphate guanylyltransferase/mannose-6-phosphate isomerase
VIHPVILCGGQGTRLWPLSRKSYPKQFSALTDGEGSLFQATARRLSGQGFAPPVVMTGSDYRFIATQQLAEAGLDPGAVLIEPAGRNTAPAVLAAALHLLATADEDEPLMLVSPSDHAIPDGLSFRAAVFQGAKSARAGQLVTFGILPDRPETGYGYLELGAPPDQPGEVVALTRFVEKPDPATAEAMVASGKYLWNAGIFLFSARAIVDAFQTHAPGIIAPVQAALDKAQPDLGFLRLDPEAWAGTEDISLDYAIMERATNIVAVPYARGWSDLGSWDAVWREGDLDGTGTVTSGPARGVDCENTLLRAEDENQALVGLGLRNIAAIAMPDAVLVADLDRAQDVGRLVKLMTREKAPQAQAFPVEHRPWGWFESLVAGPRFQVKRIVVNPGGRLSLQRHLHRSEHWVVVEGSARVTVGDEARLVAENQSIYVPVGTTHRLENPGKLPVVIIEVQTGSYLGEDDIERQDDIYARSPEGGA